MSQLSRLRLIATTDVHMHLSAKDPIRETPVASGLEALAPLIRAARAEGEPALTLDNGDILQGTPMGEWHAREGQGPHPARAALAAFGYDAAALGNHEFDFGIAHLRAALSDDGPPVLCCNLKAELPLSPGIILTRQLAGQTVRIGITGTVPPRIMVWHREALQGLLEVLPADQAVQQAAADLRRAGADLVICLAHAGIVPPGHPEEAGENSAAAIAATGAVDAIICGHQHMLFPAADFPYRDAAIDAEAGTLHGVPAIMPPALGKGIGVLDLELEHTATGWRVRQHRCNHRMPSAPTSDPALRRILAPAEASTKRRLDAPLSVSPVPLQSRFALAEDTAAIRLIHAAQLWWSEQQGLTLPVLSVASPFKCGGRNGPTFFTDIPAGPITRRAVADLYPFENALIVLQATGKELRLWLEMAASVFNTLGPTPTDLMEEGRAGFNFDSLSGVSYQIDLGQPARFDNAGAQVADSWRIKDLRWGGTPLVDDQSFAMVTNTYRSGGGGSFPCVATLPVLCPPKDPAAEVLTAYLHAHPEGVDLPAPAWSLTAPEGSVAVWQTTPGAAPDGWHEVASDGVTATYQRRFG